jgi:lipoprotein-releasing system ATP-binding protein
MTALLRTENLTRRLEGEVAVTLVKNINLSIDPGEFVAITGPSGSGKSSLLYLLGLLDRPSEGEVWLNGSPTAGLSEDERAQLRLKEIGYVFQSYFLLPEFSALDNVMLPMRRLDRLSYNDARRRADELLGALGLGDQTHKLPRQLSGGQSQRVAIARALANDPTFILADEPTGNLDTKSGALVIDIIKNLAREGRAVVMVTHDTSFAAEARRNIHIVDGRIES